MNNKKMNVSRIIALGLLLPCSLAVSANFENVSVGIQAQQTNSYKVTGVVKDANGDPVIGASIVEKGTSNGTITDFDGRFTLDVRAGSTISVSFIGYGTREFQITSDGMNLTIKLEEDTEKLDEVVVVGYGTVRKADLAGSVAVMDNKSYKDQPVTRISEALQGRVSGVQVENSGVPGGDIRIRVRGANSVNLSNEPLYVVDGIVREGGLSGINTDDIKSIQVLKDASSTAIYGSRGANGVVLVTTKTGVAGQRVITFDASVGISDVYKHYDMLSPYEYAEAYNFWYPGNGYSEDDLNALRTGQKGINWQDEMFRSGLVQNYKLAVSSGSEKTQYYLSANYVNEEGVLKYSDNERYSARANLTSQVAKWLNVTADIQFNHGIRNGNDYIANKANPIYNSLNYDPTMEMFTEDGKYNIGKNTTGGNPLGAIAASQSELRTYAATGNLSLQFNIVKGLTFTTTNAFDFQDNKSYSFSSAKSGPNSNSSMGNSDAFRMMLQSTNNLTYMNKFGKHNLTATAVWEATSTEYRNMNIGGNNLSTETVGWWNVNMAATKNLGNSYSKETLLSGVGRVIYNYNDRYTVTATIRADGSSKFSKNKWGYFPSIAAAWDISNESFMKDFKAMQDIKLRASYGIIGNQGIASYSTLGLLGQVYSNYGSQSNLYYGYWPTSLPTPDVTWEKTKQFDLGLEFALWNRRLSFSFDYFYKQTVDCLMQEPIPGYNGGGNYLANVGRIDNKGIDFSINARLIQTKDWQWTSTFTGTYLKNKVKSLGSNEYIYGKTPADKMADEATIVKPGYAIGSFYGYVWEGISADGKNVYADLNNNGAIDAGDRTVIGNANPDFTFGWNNSVNYKNWDLSMFLTGAFGMDRLNLVRYAMSTSISDASFINSKEAYEYNWDVNPQNARFASLLNGGTNYANSTQWVENASYVRLANLSLGYTLPKSLTKFADIRLSVSCQNLFTITKYKGMDPTASAFTDDSSKSVDVSSGVDIGGYPTPRTFTFGVKMNF